MSYLPAAVRRNWQQVLQPATFELACFIARRRKKPTAAECAKFAAHLPGSASIEDLFAELREQELLIECAGSIWIRYALCRMTPGPEPIDLQRFARDYARLSLDAFWSPRRRPVPPAEKMLMLKTLASLGFLSLTSANPEHRLKFFVRSHPKNKLPEYGAGTSPSTSSVGAKRSGWRHFQYKDV